VGSIPPPLVKRPRLIRYGGSDPGIRGGRGYSIGELREAGLSYDEAKALGIPVDKRRKTVWQWNVQRLREYLRAIGFRAGEQ